jgi:rhamnulokinase
VEGHNTCISDAQDYEIMNRFYAVCDLGSEVGRVMLGTLHKDKLTISEIRRFQNQPVMEKDSVHWNIPQIYQEIIVALREISGYEEPIESISCDSWASDYLLFGSDGSLITPAFHHGDSRSEAGMKEVLSKIPWESIYEETGVHKMPGNTIYQLAAEKSKRLKKNQLLPIADGFNFLLSGVPRAEMSLASTTQLYNPVARNWSDRLLQALRLPPELFPPIVPAGTKLGPLRPEIAKDTKLQDVEVVASCSYELAAELVGLPVNHGESWAYLRSGNWSVIGTELIGPVINDASRDLNFTNETGYGGSVRFSRHTHGLWIVEECKRYWREKDRELFDDVLTHLATAAEPFECLINPEDPRFYTPGDMPLKVQAFCKETDQPVPRKPGPILRCVLESLALLYRKTIQDMEQLTGREFTQLLLLNGSANNLLYHFTANALQIPVVIVPPDNAAIGNVIVQALALGHIKSLADARELVRNSFKTETITPHAAVWNAAYDRMAELAPS